MTSKKDKPLANLMAEIDIETENLMEFEVQYNGIVLSLGVMEEENKNLYRKHYEELRRLQEAATNLMKKLYRENEKQKLELEAKKKELDLKTQELEEEKKKNAANNASLAKAALELQEADENTLMRLVENQKVMKKELEEKQGEMEDLEALNTVLTVKERQSNDELQEARKQLINGLRDMLGGLRTTIRIKRMGELDPKLFHASCKRKFSEDEAAVKAAGLLSLWEDYMKDPQWYPFKIVRIDDNTDEVKAIIDEEDEKLKALKRVWGDDVYKAVSTALSELNESDASGRVTSPELWNTKEDRKATLKEVIHYILRQWKNLKRKK